MTDILSMADTFFSAELFSSALFSGAIASAFLLGLMGSSHCMGMCGGISAALGFQPPENQSQQKDLRLLSYNIGRILTYTLIGIIAGVVGNEATSALPLLGPILRTLAGLLLITMGFYLAGWWMGLTRLESIGQLLWRYLQPFTSKLLPINNHGQAFSLGILWGFLPCGLVYSTLSWALATANWKESGLLMLAFGLGTLPAMLITGFAGKKALTVLRQKQARVFASLLMIALGILTALTPWQHSGHSNHQASPSQDSMEMQEDHSHHH